MYFHKYTKECMLSARYSYDIIPKHIFSRDSFAMYSNIKYYENVTSGSRVAALLHADGQT